MKLTLDYYGQSFLLNLTPAGRAYTAEVEGTRCSVEIIRAGNDRIDFRLSDLSSPEGSLSVNDTVTTATITTDGSRRWVTLNGRTYLLTKSAAGRRAGGYAHHGAGELTAPMPGQVRAVNVSEGDPVTRGQTLLLLEAMKMEIRVQAPADGIVQLLRVKPGQTVERDQALIVLGEK